MYLLVKTGFRRQLYGWSSGASADTCPNPPAGIRLRAGDNPLWVTWIQWHEGPYPCALHQQQHWHHCLRATSQLKECQQLASLLEKQGRCCTCASQTCLGSEFHLPWSWVPLVTWGSESQVCPSKYGIIPQSAGCETEEAHFVTLSQNSTANLGWTWVLEQIQNCLFGVCGWVCGLFFWLAGWVWVFWLFFINMTQLEAFPMKGLQSRSSDRASPSVGLAWELHQRVPWKKYCFVFAQSYPWERRKFTQPAVVMTFVRIRTWENNLCLS